MCGLAGRLDWTQPPAPQALESALNRMRLRGPDDSGVWSEGPIALGHRRLSIVDLTASGHQPMVSHDGRYVIVFNGEVYNAAELRAAIDADHPRPWRGHSDTEAILEGFALWGEAVLTRLRGMFAFAIWDRQVKSLFAVRDRMGVKPFYYMERGDGIAFASRPRPLFDLCPDASRDIDPLALRYYLDIGFVPDPMGFQASVRKLPPAHFLVADQAGVRISRYWDYRSIPVRDDWASRSEADLLDELDGLVRDSVRLRLVSDVPLGAFLSGGIDSSLVTGVMAAVSQSPVETFAIGFDDPRFDESGHAQKVADHLGTRHWTETVRVDDLMSLMPLFFDQYDEPLFDVSAFATMAVCRAARQRVTVALTGDGGDELFGGYHYYGLANRMAPFFALPPIFRRGLSHLLKCVPARQAGLLSKALSLQDLPAAIGYARTLAKDLTAALAPDLTGSVCDLFSQTAGPMGGPTGAVSTGAELAMRLDAAITLPADYLQKVDVASMAFSLECREPLLDHPLVEWAAQLPANWKIGRDGTGKPLLRALAARYVPRSILDRPKQGFGVPVGQWLKGPLKQWAMDHLQESRLYDGISINRAAALGLMDRHCSGDATAEPLLWAVLVLLAGREAGNW